NWLFRARGGGIAGRLVNASSRRTVHPLPGGEGRGEGEHFIRRDLGSRGVSTLLKKHRSAVPMGLRSYVAVWVWISGLGVVSGFGIRTSDFVLRLPVSGFRPLAMLTT